ncbi:hypothetical protein SAMN02927900_01580 [Rhizobium mongolense subsp. loessense]|uniref:Uncharacterized protein n=1 Tax=Rhizobium mongolense subsp. loessense TaxID=158890 RepID=A0A1G4QMV7_9HYPH|nr:hypothetical protein [Rhizobium mongolense]SCW45409.1 hypothetical protein SAMN02927900_01580 [Rhizobium mongolense subsp. loessense]
MLDYLPFWKKVDRSSNRQYVTTLAVLLAHLSPARSIDGMEEPLFPIYLVYRVVPELPRAPLAARYPFRPFICWRLRAALSSSIDTNDRLAPLRNLLATTAIEPELLSA